MMVIRNRKYRTFVGLMIFLIVITISYFIVFSNKGKPAQTQVCPLYLQTLIEKINDGDIITRLGDRFWSEIIRNISTEDKRFSHVGIIRINDEKITVIHAEGTTTAGKDFVKEETLEDFLKVAKAVGIYRLKNHNTESISDTAMEFIGVPFDWKFDMTDDTALYCTELLYVVFKRLGIDVELKTTFVKEIGREIIPIEAVSRGEGFEEL